MHRAGSASAVSQIQELQPVGTMQSPEMERMGIKIELDKDSGKFKVVNTKPHLTTPQQQ